MLAVLLESGMLAVLLESGYHLPIAGNFKWLLIPIPS